MFPRSVHPVPRARARVARLTAALFVTVAALSTPVSVAAHAELDSITPADGSTVSTPPAQISGQFTQPMDAAKSSMVLVDASGAVVAQGSTVDPSNTMTLPITTTLANGTYTVRWTTLSQEDNEIARGTTTFTVAVAATPSPSVAPSAPPSGAASVTPSVAPSVASSVGPSPSGPPTPPTASTSDAVIPIVAALIVLAAIALWLRRGRIRAGR